MSEGGASIEGADVQIPQPAVECKPEAKSLSLKQKLLQFLGISAIAAAGVGGVACSDNNDTELSTKPYNDATASAAITARKAGDIATATQEAFNKNWDETVKNNLNGALPAPVQTQQAIGRKTP